MRPHTRRSDRPDRGGRRSRCRSSAAAAVFVTLSHVASVPARAYMADGNPQAAYDALTVHESSLAGDPGHDYPLEIAAMDSGHLTHSVFALERLLAVQPDNVLARAEIARVYLMLGEVRTSPRKFETVRKSEKLPQATRNTVERYLTAFPNLPEQGAGFEKDGALSCSPASGLRPGIRGRFGPRWSLSGALRIAAPIASNSRPC